MAWKEVNVEDQRKKFVLECLEGNLKMAELCRLYDISRQNGYKWLNRYKIGGLEALKDQSRAPLTQAFKTNPELVNDILEIKFLWRKWGPKKILGWLKTHRPELEWPSTTTIGNILDKNGLVIPRKYRKRVPGKTVPLSHCQQANDVWCTDFKGWFLTGDNQKCEPFTLTDGATRFLIRCLKLHSNNAENVWGALDGAFREFGLPRFLRNDNGSPFGTCGVGRLSALSVKLIKAGVTPEWIDPGKPQQNGRHERMHQTLKNETANPPEPTLEMQDMKFKEFLNYFNFIRPHEALDQKTPGSIYRPSNRVWTGRFESPEYPSEYVVRKVRINGEIKWKGELPFLGRVLYGEPVGLKEEENGAWKVFYGPIILGFIDNNNQFTSPEGAKRRKNQKYGKNKGKAIM
jgi:putative transposase